MREGTITPNWKHIVQLNSQSDALDYIDLKDTWLTPDLKEDPSKNPNRVPRVAPENNRNMITSLQIVYQIQ